MSALEEIRRANAVKRKALASLHLELGYPTAQALAQAILDAAGQGGNVDTGAKRAVTSPRGSGKRLSPEDRRAIITALKSGRTGTEVTREFGVSYPTVHEIKRSLGLVTPRPTAGKRAGRASRKRTQKQ